MEITPKNVDLDPALSVTAGPSVLHSANDFVLAPNVGGMNVTAASATVTVPVLSWPNDNVAGLYLVLNVDGPGGGSFPLKRYYICEGVVHETNFPLPNVNLTGCGQIYLLYKVISWSGFTRCGPRESTFKFATGSIGSGGASFSVEDTVFNQFSVPVPVSAQVSVSASALAGSEFTNLAAVPTLEELACSQAAAVNFSALNNNGQPLSFCSGTAYPTTVGLEGVGPFAYVRKGTSEGASINFSMESSTSSFDVVVDTSRGIIPMGFQVATLRVNVDGIEQTKTISFRCNYPPPEVMITNPSTDITVELTASNQPVIILEEEHSPTSGQFAPSITWSPGNTINTAEYYGQIEDSLVVVVTVTAENIAGMTASDTRRITLKKKGCEDAPECSSNQSLTAISTEEVSLDYPNLSENPCQTQEALDLGAAGVFRALKETEEPILPFNPEVCFDRISNSWRFSVTNLKIRVIVAICEQELRARGFKLINSTDEVPDSDVCDAYFHLLNQYGYPPGAPPGGYFFLPVVLAHERVHKRQYEFHLKQARKEMFDTPLANLALPCEAMSSLEDATKKARQEIALLALRLMKEASSRSARAKKSIGRQEFELLTQQDRSVIKLLDQAVMELDRRCN